jgi:2-hydroxychromene-2-carboxylate isomerase
MQRLTFWFEYGSTYTWLSVARIDALAQAQGAQIEWRPFLLSAILKQRGMVEGPFAEPIKGRYMWRDLERRAARHAARLLCDRFFARWMEATRARRAR